LFNNDWVWDITHWLYSHACPFFTRNVDSFIQAYRKLALKLEDNFNQFLET